LSKTFRYRVEKPEPTDIVTLDEARAYLNMDIQGVTFADSKIIGFIKSAVAYVEKRINVSFGISTYKWNVGWYSQRHRNCVRIPDTFYVKSIVAIKATDQEGNEVTVAPANYSLRRIGERLSEIRWANDYYVEPYNEYEIEFTAGFDPSDEPYADLKQAILLLVGSWYDTRVDTVAEKRTLADKMINQHVIGYA
jgi:uncharacterized phiE125 gp8 family phage protein